MIRDFNDHLMRKLKLDYVIRLCYPKCSYLLWLGFKMNAKFKAVARVGYKFCGRIYHKIFRIILDRHLDRYYRLGYREDTYAREEVFYQNFPFVNCSSCNKTDLLVTPPDWSTLNFESYTQELLEKRGFNQVFRDKFKDRKPIVLFAGNDAEQDKSGFIQDLSKVCEEVYLFYQDDGSYGTAHYGFNMGRLLNCKEANSFINTTKICEIIDNAPANAKPDLLMIQGWGWNYSPRDLLLIKHRYKDLKILNLQMDDAAGYGLDSPLGTHAILPFIDLALTTAPEKVEWILKEGTPAFYFPLASSLDFYHPLENVERIYDIGFVGLNYGGRGEMIKALEKENFKVKAYGHGWGGGGDYP